MKRIIWLICLALLIIVIIDKSGPSRIPSMKIPAYLVKEYIQVGNKYKIPWAYLAALDEVEYKYQGTSLNKIEKRAKILRNHSSNNIDEIIKELYPNEKSNQIIQIASAYQWGAPMLHENYQFPFRLQDLKKLSYHDTWGASRTYGGKRKHEGTDLMIRKGIPILAVTDGLIINKGWNRLGGWRISLMDVHHPQIVYYYAHLSKFVPQFHVGNYVKKGEIIGYVGDSGYGKEGTTGKFPPHLHFGIYVREGLFTFSSQAINPYPFLKAWDPR